MRIIIVATAALAITAAPGIAQVKPRPDSTSDTLSFVLEPLRVNAAREQSAAPPVPIVRIAPTLLRRTPASTSYDLIRRVAGIEVHEQGQGPGFASDVVVSGFTSDHSQDVLLVIDNVPVNLPISGHAEGYADWSTLLPAAISSTRLIYGSASPLYGDFALAGVLEVFTSADADQTEGAFSGTSDRDWGAWLSTGARHERSGHLEAADVRDHHGWRDNSDSRSGNALLRAWQSVGNGRLEGGISGSGARWSSPGFLSLAQFESGDLKHAADPTDGGDQSRGVVHGRFTQTIGIDRSLDVSAWGMLSQWNLFLNIPEDEDEPVEQTYEHDGRHGLGAQAEMTKLSRHGDFTVGISGRADGAHFELGHAHHASIEELHESFDARYRAGAAYARWRGNFGGRLGLDLGARLDVVHHASADLLEGGDWRGATTTVFAPKLGARYFLNSHMTLNGSLSHGFRGAAGTVEDPTRPPVLAWASEIGLDHSSEELRVFAGLFRIDVDHERQLDPITRVITNAGSSTRQGVNARVEWTPTDKLSLRASGTYNHARLSGEFADEHAAHEPAALRSAALLMQQDTAGEFAHQVPGVAQYFGSLKAEVRITPRAALNADLQVNGPFVPIGETDVRTETYSLLDVGTTILFGERAELDLALTNVSDTKYAELRASGFVNPGAPRALRATLRVTR